MSSSFKSFSVLHQDDEQLRDLERLEREHMDAVVDKFQSQIYADSDDDAIHQQDAITFTSSENLLDKTNEDVITADAKFPRFLSVPALREFHHHKQRADEELRREISSSPARSEKHFKRTVVEDNFRLRPLSQDNQNPKTHDPFQKSGKKDMLESCLNTFNNDHDTHNVYNINVNALETNEDSSHTHHGNNNNNNHHHLESSEPNKSSQASWKSATSWFRRRTGTAKIASMALPLPTHLELESAEPSPTQAFGPKINGFYANSDVDATNLALNLDASLAGSLTLQENLKDSTSLVDTEAHEQNPNTTDAELLSKGSTTISLENSMRSSRQSSRRTSKRNSTPTTATTNHINYNNNNNNHINNNSSSNEEIYDGNKQEFQDPESLMFRDGRRKIDMVLAWEEENFGVMTEIEAKKREHRRIFVENLIKEGLEVELEDKSQSFDEKTFFLKIHLPWRLESRLAELMNLKLPTKRFITIAVKNSWDETKYTLSSMQYWKNLWKRLTYKIQLDESLQETETTFKAATANGNPLEQFIVKDRATSYTSAQRSLMIMQILVRTPFDANDRSGIRRLLSNSTYLACFPLHEGRYDKSHTSGVDFDRRLLYLTWAHPSQWYKKQPLCLVRKYFGDKIGLYFCWLGFYTEMLVYPAIVGTICFIYGLLSFESPDNTPAKEICDRKGVGNITLCPLCDQACSYQDLKESCLFARLTYLFDNPSTVFFAIFMSFWATTFLELWKRKQSVIVWEWDLHNIDADEENRPEFEANATTFRMNPVTREKEPFMSTWSRATRFAITGSAVCFMIAVVLCAVLGTIIYRISVVSVIYGGGSFFVKEHAKLFTTVTAAFINLIVIMILTRVYHHMVLKLTNLENPRTQTEYEDSYTFKIFLFEFMNFYSSLIYIAFFKGRFFDYPGDDQARRSEFFRLKNDVCDPAGCLSELCIQLAIIMVGKQCWNNFMEYLFPKLYNWWRQRKHKQATKDESHLHMAWEQDYHLQDPGRLALFDEYLEMILQYGFVTLFVAAFPLAPLFALLNNVAEIRLDAYKMVTQARRPLAERVQDIGAWYGILRIITYTAVVSNAFVIAYTSDFIPRMVYKFVYSETHTLQGYIEHSLSTFNTSDYKEEWGRRNEKDPDLCMYRGYRNGPDDVDPYGLSPHYWHVFAARLAFVVVFEHVVFVMTGIMQFIIPDIPAEVKTQMQRELLLAKEAKYQQGLQRAQNRDDHDDVASIFREISNRRSSNGNSNNNLTSRGAWARRFSRMTDGLEAHVEVAARPRQSVESTVWEVS